MPGGQFPLAALGRPHSPSRCACRASGGPGGSQGSRGVIFGIVTQEKTPSTQLGEGKRLMQLSVGLTHTSVAEDFRDKWAQEALEFPGKEKGM